MKPRARTTNPIMAGGRTRLTLVSAAALLGFANLAQAHAPTAPAVTTQIVMLGTAGGPPLQKQRSQPATLLLVEGTPYLFDCGTGTVRQLARAGIPPSTIRAIFISHHHADHDLDLATLIGNDQFEFSWAEKATRSAIYGPKGTIEMVRAARAFVAVAFDAFAQEGLGSKTDLGKSNDAALFEPHEISAGEIYRDALIQVTAVENSHYALMPEDARRWLKSYSFRIQTPDAVIVITGDTGKSDAVTQISHNADVLVTEAMDVPAMFGFLERRVASGAMSADALEIRKEHMRVEHIDLPDIGNMARTASIGSVILTHLGPEASIQSGDQLTSKARGSYAGQLFAAEDLDRYCVLPAGARQKGVLKRC